MAQLYPPNLGPGSYGAAVTSLQNILRKLYKFLDVDINGVYDGKTENAVRQLQENIGCQITGFLEQQTREALRLKIGLNIDGIFFPDSDPDAPRNFDPESPDITYYTLPGIPGELTWDFRVAMAA